MPNETMVQWDKIKFDQHWLHFQNYTIFNISTVSGHILYSWKWFQAGYGSIYHRNLKGWLERTRLSTRRHGLPILATEIVEPQVSLSHPCFHGVLSFGFEKENANFSFSLPYTNIFFCFALLFLVREGLRECRLAWYLVCSRGCPWASYILAFIFQVG